MKYNLIDYLFFVKRKSQMKGKKWVSRYLMHLVCKEMFILVLMNTNLLPVKIRVSIVKPLILVELIMEKNYA